MKRLKDWIDRWVIPTPSAREAEDIEFMNDVEASIRRSGHRFAFILSATSALVIIVFLIWAKFAILDEVTRGQGQVIPSLKTQILQNLEGGIVSEIMVHEGEIVKKGDILVRIDNALAESTLKEKQARANFLRANIARLTSEIEDKELSFPEDLLQHAPQVVANEKEQYSLRQQQRDAQIQVLKTQASQRRQEVKELRSRLSQLRNNLAVVNEEYNLTKPLVDSGVMSRVDLLRIEGNKTDLEGEIRTINLSIPRAQSAAAEADQKVKEFTAGFRADAAKELNAAKAELDSLEQVLTAGEDKVTRTQVRAPVDGTVKALHVNTVGEVIKPGEDIAEITPMDDTLLIEAKIKPADRAFIRPGQISKIKITAYDFSIYGGLDGKVENISSDTITDDEGNAFYKISVRTDQTAITHHGKELPIIPGMTATVEILTGEKSVLDYIMKPILKAKQNAMRER